MPAALRARSFSFVTVSGLPASTVYSLSVLKSKLFSTAANSLVKCSAESVVGVPPPKYTVSSFKPSLLAYLPVSSISFIRS